MRALQQVGFPEANKVLGPPQGMTEEECGSLEVYQDEEKSISCWLLREEDLKQIQETKRVWLWVVGGQPPVIVSTENPFEDGK